VVTQTVDRSSARDSFEAEDKGSTREKRGVFGQIKVTHTRNGKASEGEGRDTQSINDQRKRWMERRDDGRGWTNSCKGKISRGEGERSKVTGPDHKKMEQGMHRANELGATAHVIDNRSRTNSRKRST
jgi:hypothetical protein